ncbi:C6 transcription factor [Aspergillus eucalypticola CBS 122712]|uniref:C6 transcription factor n=1 Tax=Aspergillus eucalypticola (strain CBS 122712 / IBT 29274) TaxID=1448314 RepID=A0A317VN21_ASPEC|nr:C6 transcription factor [Aspergillus eucalypticola CBS 122712]PWY75733.1 C6 transcription factor [Aspergillus eucalypticola CBS 122712]
MVSPSSFDSRLEENETDWHAAPRAAKRRKRASSAGVSRPSPREIGVMRESQNDGPATFLGSSSGIHFVRQVYNAFARRSAELQRARNRTSVPGEDDRLQRNSGDFNSYSTDELWSKGELNCELDPSFSFDDLASWTRRYFEDWHPIFPFLHAPTVLKSMETLAKQGISAVSRLDMIIIRSLVSISLADNRQTDGSGANTEPVPATLVFQSVRHIIEDIQSLLMEPTTVPLLQATFCAQLTLTSLLRLNAASRVGGVITRTAYHLGLHRCPARFSCFGSHEKDIRYRLFWSIYTLERYLSQALGIPLSIRDDDIDVCYPGEERHSTTPLTSHGHTNSRLRLLCHLAKFARVRGLIIELRNKSVLHSHASPVEASYVNGELSQWWNEVYDDVYPTEDDEDTETREDSPLASYHRLLLIVLRHEAIISMNRPLLTAEKPNQDQDYKNALQTCIESSRSALAALKKYMSSPSQAPMTWPSFTWTTWMACLILMYASWEGELPINTALKYGRMGTSVLRNLALRGSSWPETCIEGIKSMVSALSMNQSSREHENAAGILTDGNASQLGHSDTRGTMRRAPRHRSHPSASMGMNSAFPNIHSTGPTVSHGRSPSMSPQQFEPSTDSAPQGVNPTEHCDSSNIIRNASVIIDINSSDGSHAQTSAGLIFGNMANSNAVLNHGIGQDPLSFPDPSYLFMNDLWSVADGPWIIHENML